MPWLPAGCLLVQTRWYTTQTLMDVRQAWDLGLSTNCLTSYKWNVIWCCICQVVVKSEAWLETVCAIIKVSSFLSAHISRFHTEFVFTAVLYILSHWYNNYTVSGKILKGWNFDECMLAKLLSGKVTSALYTKYFRGKFWLGNFWQIDYHLPNSPIFTPPVFPQVQYTTSHYVLLFI